MDSIQFLKVLKSLLSHAQNDLSHLNSVRHHCLIANGKEATGDSLEFRQLDSKNKAQFKDFD